MQVTISTKPSNVEWFFGQRLPRIIDQLHDKYPRGPVRMTLRQGTVATEVMQRLFADACFTLQQHKTDKDMKSRVKALCPVLEAELRTVGFLSSKLRTSFDTPRDSWKVELTARSTNNRVYNAKQMIPAWRFV